MYDFFLYTNHFPNQIKSGEFWKESKSHDFTIKHNILKQKMNRNWVKVKLELHQAPVVHF